MWEQSTGTLSSHLLSKGVLADMPWISDLQTIPHSTYPLPLLCWQTCPRSRRTSMLRFALQLREGHRYGLLLQMKEATPKEEISRGKPFVSEVN